MIDPNLYAQKVDETERLVRENAALREKLGRFLDLRKRFSKYYRSACGRMNFHFPPMKVTKHLPTVTKIVPVEVDASDVDTHVSFNMEDFPGLYEFVHWEDDFPNTCGVEVVWGCDSARCDEPLPCKKHPAADPKQEACLECGDDDVTLGSCQQVVENGKVQWEKLHCQACCKKPKDWRALGDRAMGEVKP